MQFAIRLPVWVQVPLLSASKAALDNRANILKACNIDHVIPRDAYLDENATVKVHVDYLDEETHEVFRKEMMAKYGVPGLYYYDVGSDDWNTFPCRHRHDRAVCKCHLPLYHVGQDEAIFKQFALPSCCWSIRGKIKLRPKSEGQGVMVSAFFCEVRGFGLRLTKPEIDIINATRRERSLATGRPLRKDIEYDSSPGLIFFEYGNGKGKQGYWDGAKFQEQVIDFLDVLEILYPNMQVLIEVDHSSGHLKEQSDGLMVNAMGVNWGGKTLPKRDSVMEEGCLGPNPPDINGRRLTIGATQRMIFEDGDPQPFNDLKALPNDRPMTPAEVTKEKEKRQKKAQRSLTKEVNEDEEVVEAPFIIPGYIGKNKGILQV